MKKLFLLTLALFFITNTQAQTDKRLKGLDKTLTEVLDATKAAGFAVAVVQGDKIVYAKGFGYRDFENKIPVDANTLFAIGSSSKAFTSAILGQLSNEDKLSLDDNPRDYIPELKFYNNELNNGVIIKDLMSHRTGLPRHDWSWYLFPTHDKDSLLQRLEFQEPFAGVREQWYYNNFMFLTQGVIAERITGKSWEDNIAERFFKPLGMSRSNSTINDMKSASNAAFGYELKKNDVISKMDYYDIAAMSPAGSINSSVNDMSNWMRMWLNKGKFNDTEVLTEAYITDAMSSHAVINGGFPDDEFPDMHLANYGYGWIISSYRGHYRVQHGGNIDGFSANVALYPSDDLGIVVLANQNGSAVPGMVRNIIADRMLKTDKTDWVKRFIERREKAKEAQEEAKSEDSSNQVKNTKPSHVLQDYTGVYSNSGYGTFNVKVENDSLFAFFKLKTAYLNHFHYDVFEAYEKTNSGIDTSDTAIIKMNFISNEAGDISYAKLKMEPTVDPIEFKRTPNTIDVDDSTLEKYIGQYELSGTPIKVYIKNKKLFVFVPGQPEYELLATAKHKFSFKALEGFKVEFLESLDGSINEANVIQPNGTFKVNRKKE